MKNSRFLPAPLLYLVLSAFAFTAEANNRWVGTWATSPQLAEPQNRPPAPGLTGTTLRQIIHVSLGGKTVRARFSNAFGHTPLVLNAVQLARSAGGGAISPETSRAITFGGAPSVTIQPGALVVSDPCDFDLAPLANVAITMQLKDTPSDLTAHPGSRTTSYFQTGVAATVTALPDATKTDHWFFLNGLDVLADSSAAAIVIIGDSITDGRGSTTNGNDRWPDQLARRLQANQDTADIGVLNHGIGGNRLLRDGLGPNVLARFDRDVLAQSGVRWLIVFEGVNDLGTAVGARAQSESGATAQDIISAYQQIVVRAHTHNIRVFGATISPFGGFASYFRPESEADRQAVNQWIRTGGVFDGVIDFDRIARDPANPSRLIAAVDGGDHLHPSAAGYKLMADAIDLALFAR